MLNFYMDTLWEEIDKIFLYDSFCCRLGIYIAFCIWNILFTEIHINVVITPFSYDNMIINNMKLGARMNHQYIGKPARARICKPFKEPRNRFPPAWRADRTTLFDVTARSGYISWWNRLLGIDSWPLTRLQIRAQCHANYVGNVLFICSQYGEYTRLYT